MALFTFVEEEIEETEAKASRTGTPRLSVEEFLAPVASLLSNADKRAVNPTLKPVKITIPLGMQKAAIYSVANAAVRAFVQLNAERPESVRFHTSAVLRAQCSQYRPAGVHKSVSKKSGLEVTRPVTERQANVVIRLDVNAKKADLVHYHGAEHKAYRKVQEALEAAGNGTLDNLETVATVSGTDALTERKPSEVHAGETRDPVSQTVRNGRGK